MKKKGDLSLSVNAIVVLILAITMLGLGLGFMKGMFGKVSGNIDKAISSGELETPATANTPFTVSTKDFELKRGTSTRLDFGYFNDQNAKATIAYTDITCKSGADDTETDFDFTYPSEKDVEVNQAIAFSILMAAKTTATSRTSVCTIELTTTLSTGVGKSYTKDIFVKVP